MKKIIAAAAVSAAVLLCGCTEISSEAPREETVTETASETVTETSAPEIQPAEAETQITEEEKAPDSEDFFSDYFENSDYKTGRIADDMNSALLSLKEDYSAAELSVENIKEIMGNDGLSDTLFRFSVPRCDGVLPAQSSAGDMFAFGFSDEEGTEYAVILGSEDSSDISDADKYVSTCTEVEYLAFCSERDGQLALMPIAAGNSQCGVYGVLPVAEYCGYDMSDTEEFEGIPDSISVSLSVSEDGGVYYTVSHRFENDVYYVFDSIFLNGGNMTDSISEETSSVMKGSGSIAFNDTQIVSGDAFYFVGTVYDADTDELICDASFAAVAADPADE